MRLLRARSLALVLASAGAGASCSARSDEPVETSAARVVGGTADTSHAAVVALVRKSDGALCSGMLVAPTVVLTAAHCVVGVPASDLEVRVGATADSPDATLAVVSAVAYPTYVAGAAGVAGGVDLGAVNLAQPADPAPLAVDTTTTDATLAGARVEVVGYGLTTTVDETSGGTRHVASLTVRDVCTRRVTAGDDTANACLGDSGGALLLGGAIVAVVSGGALDCAAPTTFTRTDAHARWIAAVIAGDASAACPSCVAPDVACGAATETAPAISGDAGLVDAEAGALDGATTSAAPGSNAGCALARPRDATSDARTLEPAAFACATLFAALRRRRPRGARKAG